MGAMEFSMDYSRECNISLIRVPSEVPLEVHRNELRSEPVQGQIKLISRFSLQNRSKLVYFRSRRCGNVINHDGDVLSSC